MIYCTAALTSFSDSISYITYLFSEWRIQEDIDLPFVSNEKYVSPRIAEVNELDFSDSVSIEELTKTLTKAIVRRSMNLTPPPKRTNYKNKKSYCKLPEHVKMALANHSAAFCI